MSWFSKEFCSVRKISRVWKEWGSLYKGIKVAKSLYDQLIKIIQHLCEMPRIGHIVDNEFDRRDDVRWLPIDNYILYYVIDDEEKIINVLRVVSARRDQHLIISSIINCANQSAVSGSAGDWTARGPVLNSRKRWVGGWHCLGLNMWELSHVRCFRFLSGYKCHWFIWLTTLLFIVSRKYSDISPKSFIEK